MEGCAVCGGSGWIIAERDGISAADRCECAHASRHEAIRERAGIPPLYEKARIDTFLLPEGPSKKDAAQMVRDLNRYIEIYPDPGKPGLLFIGPPGTGKTHLAAGVLHALLARGFEGVFFDFQNLLDRIRSGYDQASGTMDREAYRTALETEIVVLDDLGAHRVTDWVEDTVTSIITHRCNHRKPTIVTTNLLENAPAERRGGGLPEAIYGKYLLEERIGMRARSRLFEMCRVFRMPDVGDYRLKKR